MATTIDLGKIRLQWKGDYSNATSYELLDVVKFKGDSYVFISTIAAANKTPDTTSEWDLMVSGGDQWSTGTSVPTGGNPGDMYLKTDDEKIYENVAGTWTVKLDIGGGVWTSSTSNGAGGESGDWHVNTATKDIQENVSGTWTTRVTLSLSGSNIQDLGNVPALSSGKFLTNDGTSTSWATVDVTGASVGGDVSGTVSNIQIAANAVTDTELNSAKLNNVADNANNYSHPGTHPASMLTGALPAIDGSALTGIDAATVSTTAPSSPAQGDMWFDTTAGTTAMKVWSGSGWDTLSNRFSATGGTESTYSSGGTNYKVHTFTSSGTFTATASGSVDVLLVAGGGGGGFGFNVSGAGGAG